MDGNRATVGFLVEAELRSLHTKHGALEASDVVEAARNPASAMHAHFEWDDAAAGHAYRLHQARALIRSVSITITVESVSLRAPAFVRDPQMASGYVALQAVRDDEAAARRVIVSEVERAVSALARAEAVAAALGVVGPLAAAAEAVAALRAALAR